MGVPELNVGDVIDVVKSVVHGECDGCMFADTASHYMIQCLPDCMLKLRDGPKQGDTVWGRHLVFDEEVTGLFMAEYEGIYLVLIEGGEILKCRSVTTTDPYALKYDLTPQEALVAIGQGKIVEDNHGTKYRFADCGLVSKQKHLKKWRMRHFITNNDMYAIVEE